MGACRRGCSPIEVINKMMMMMTLFICARRRSRLPPSLERRAISASSPKPVDALGICRSQRLSRTRLAGATRQAGRLHACVIRPANTCFVFRVGHSSLIRAVVMAVATPLRWAPPNKWCILAINLNLCSAVVYYSLPILCDCDFLIR